jgi:hypothetical protein
VEIKVRHLGGIQILLVECHIQALRAVSDMMLRLEKRSLRQRRGFIPRNIKRERVHISIENYS